MQPGARLCGPGRTALELLMWLLASLFAVICQTARNGLARSLTPHVSAPLNSWCRFAFAVPYAAALVSVLIARHGIPRASAVFFVFCFGIAITQLSANVALVAAFHRSSFAQAIVLHKLDAVFGALLGVLFFAERPSPLGWAGVVVSTLGMVLINLGREGGRRPLHQAFRLDAGAGLALGCAALLALTSFLIKEAVDEFLRLNAQWGARRFEGVVHVLFHTTWMEVGLLTASIALHSPAEFRKVPRHAGRMALVGLASFAGSLGWFWAFSVALVAYVRAVSQIEAVFAVAISFFLLRERQVVHQIPGVLLVLAGIGLILFD